MLLVLAVFLAGLAASYWGAGLLVKPPRMSPLTLFPDAFGVPYERVALRAADGHALAGWFVPAPAASGACVLVCHGWGDNKGLTLSRALPLRERLGANLLFLDFRGHGESAPSPVTMGKLELRDFESALDWLAAERPGAARAVGVLAVSMGASVAALGLARRPEVRAAVLESPFPDYHQVGARWAWSELRVPYFPLVLLVMWWARLRSGHADIDAYSPEREAPGARRPALFIAGERDVLMPPQDVERLRRAWGGPSDLWVVPGAVHGKCLDADPAGYCERAAAFLRPHLTAS